MVQSFVLVLNQARTISRVFLFSYVFTFILNVHDKHRGQRASFGYFSKVHFPVLITSVSYMISLSSITFLFSFGTALIRAAVVVDFSPTADSQFMAKILFQMNRVT
jgi:hypothetical protein